MTIAIGIGGSFFGGLIGRGPLRRRRRLPAVVIFAAVIVYLVRRSRGGGLTDPGAPPG